MKPSTWPVKSLKTAFRTTEETLFWVFGAVVLLSILLGVALQEWVLFGAPALLLFGYLVVVDFKLVFFLLLATLPLSTEVTLPNGFGTDLPSEPLMIGLMLVYVLYVIRHGRALGADLLRHPITLVLLLHLGWIFVTTLMSDAPVVSLKFFLAKLWYVFTFYFLAILLLREEVDFRRYFWFVFIPLLFTVLVAIVRHAGYGFSFEFVHKVLHPFYRNHVAYASIISVFLPFVWYLRRWYPRGGRRWYLLTAALVVLLVAIQLSYTRAAYVSLVIAIGAYYVIRYRLTRYALLLALAGALGVVVYFAYDNTYLDYAPRYEQVVSHTDFNNLLEATYQGEDISTMERVYRWIAGFYMSQDRPLFGWGPGNFYNFYRPYTVTSFQTYVSDNPEKSGIHSYYLMTMTDQGYPGLAIFLLLIAVVLLRGEAVYHRLTDPRQRDTAMMFLLSFIIILTLLIINDLIETDKIGPFFFMAMAVLVNLDLSKGASGHPRKPGSQSA